MNHSAQRVDIAVLCHNAHTLLVLTKPLTELFRAIHRLQNWESPLLCAIVLVITTSVTLFLPSIYILVANLTFLGILASLGIANAKGNILSKVLPSPIPTDTLGNYVKDLPEEDQHEDIMKQFKEILFHLDRWMLAVTEVMEKVYEVVKWKNYNYTARIYIMMAIVLMAVHAIPPRWTIMLFINCFVVYRPVKLFIIQKFGQKPEVLQQEAESARKSDEISISQVLPEDEDDIDEDMTSENYSTEASDTEGMDFENDEPDHKVVEPVESHSELNESNNPNETLVGDKEEITDDAAHPQEIEHSGELNFDVIKKTEIQQSNFDARLELNDSIEFGSRLSSSPNRPSSVVGRLMEFRRKQQQTHTGTCVGCRTNFSTILKRKRTCNYCGNNFCAKCCSFKVPKSSLGVTAPGSQTEQVVVCQDCYGYLNLAQKEVVSS